MDAVKQILAGFDVKLHGDEEVVLGGGTRSEDAVAVAWTSNGLNAELRLVDI
jgi:hypothetical protein